MSAAHDEAIKAARAIAAQFGATLSPLELEAVAVLVVGVVDLATGAALKRAAAAGVAAAAKVETVEEANEVLKAAAAAMESK